MPRNPKRPGAGASTSFRRDEVQAMRELLSALRQGRDVSVLLRSEAVARVERKVYAMDRRITLERAAAAMERVEARARG